jgi:hypothetical protein
MAQTTLGTILGSVTDPSGAAVQGAEVKALNVAENLEITATTNGAGDFELLELKPGPYVLTVSAPGFRLFRATGLALQARQRLRVNAKLEVGELAQASR